MASTLHQHSEYAQTSLYNSRAYIYYSRYPVAKTPATHFPWRKAFRIVCNYTRLLIVTGMMALFGAALPILLAVELFFKPMLADTCNQCLIITARPFFALDLLSSTFMVVMGFIMPLLTVMLVVKVLRSKVIQRELFY